MNRYLVPALLGGLLAAVPSALGAFADQVISYTAGSGADVRYNNPNAALGSPTRVNPFGDEVVPFNAPYGVGDLVSLGEGGSLTLHLSQPILEDATHPYGMDFIVFGHAGFNIVNGEFSDYSKSQTDGTFYTAAPGVSRISVSADNVTWYQLAPTIPSSLDALFPTDGAGDFSLPVNPTLTAQSFDGLNLPGVRSLYQGSGGGTGFDLSWTVGGGLSQANYIRIEMIQGSAFVDGVSAVPEPGTLSLAAAGVVVLGLGLRRARGRQTILFTR